MTNRQKQIIILVSLIFFLLVGISVYSQEPPPTPPILSQPQQNKTKPQQTKSNHKERGSDDFPLVVKIIGTNTPQPKESNYTKNTNENTTTNWLLVFFNGLLAFFTFGLYKYNRKMWKSTDIAANAAQQAAESTKNSVDNISKIERAYIFVTVEKDIETFKLVYDDNDGFKGNYLFKATVKLWNLGRTPAVITKIRAVISLEKAEIPEIEESEIPSGIVVGSDKSKDITAFKHINDIDRQNIINWNTPAYCCGRIEYQDVFHGKWVRGFCWEYKPHSSRPTEPWVISNNKELNYEKKQKEGD